MKNNFKKNKFSLVIIFLFIGQNLNSKVNAGNITVKDQKKSVQRKSPRRCFKDFCIAFSECQLVYPETLFYGSALLLGYFHDSHPYDNVIDFVNFLIEKKLTLQAVDLFNFNKYKFDLLNSSFFEKFEDFKKYKKSRSNIQVEAQPRNAQVDGDSINSQNVAGNRQNPDGPPNLKNFSIAYSDFCLKEHNLNHSLMLAAKMFNFLYETAPSIPMWAIVDEIREEGLSIENIDDFDFMENFILDFIDKQKSKLSNNNECDNQDAVENNKNESAKENVDEELKPYGENAKEDKESENDMHPDKKGDEEQYLNLSAQDEQEEIEHIPNREILCRKNFAYHLCQNNGLMSGGSFDSIFTKLEGTVKEYIPHFVEESRRTLIINELIEQNFKYMIDILTGYLFSLKNESDFTQEEIVKINNFYENQIILININKEKIIKYLNDRKNEIKDFLKNNSE